MHAKFWSENLKGGDFLEDIGLDNTELDYKEIMSKM
jgi:hypothetical protein